MATLTDAKIRRLGPGRYPLEHTVHLWTKPNGRCYWVQRLTIAGRRRELRLGPWPVVSVEQARRKALENHRVVYDRKDPKGRDPHDPRHEGANSMLSQAVTNAEELLAQLKTAGDAAQQLAELEKREGMLDAIWKWNRAEPTQQVTRPTGGQGIKR